MSPFGTCVSAVHTHQENKFGLTVKPIYDLYLILISVRNALFLMHLKLKVNNKNDMAAHTFLACFCFCQRPSEISPKAENDAASSFLVCTIPKLYTVPKKRTRTSHMSFNTSNQGWTL